MRRVVKKNKNTLQDETHIVRLHGIYDVHIVDAKILFEAKYHGEQVKIWSKVEVSSL